MRQLIAGNWKMNGLSSEAARLATGIRDGAAGLGCDLLVCPPHTVLAATAGLLDGSPVAVGGQDCHPAAQGPHTGDVSAGMLRDAGATWVVLGHSERRRDHGETDAEVKAKVVAAVAAGLRPIVCVGETEAQRQAGAQEQVIAGQLAGSLTDGFRGVVAYEPTWAIGTGRIASTSDIAAMHGLIRRDLLSRLGEYGREVLILYGGSVKPDNAAVTLAVPEVGGALVGGASLDAAAFLAIARAAR